jgi:hypothetical protein
MLQFHTGNEASAPPESLLKTRLAIDKARLSRLATQSAIGRSRTALAETIALLVTLKCVSPKRQDVESNEDACQGLTRSSGRMGRPFPHQGKRAATGTI